VRRTRLGIIGSDGRCHIHPITLHGPLAPSCQALLGRRVGLTFFLDEARGRRAFWRDVTSRPDAASRRDLIGSDAHRVSCSTLDTSVRRPGGTPRERSSEIDQNPNRTKDSLRDESSCYLAIPMWEVGTSNHLGDRRRVLRTVQTTKTKVNSVTQHVSHTYL
jgi:hypothetical protein